MRQSILELIPRTAAPHVNVSAKCRALVAPASVEGRTAPVTWAQLDFCAGCTDAAGCHAFCSCFLQHVEGRPFDCQSTVVTSANAIRAKGTNAGGAWGSLLPLSILIFFGGFLCQMYIKNNKRAPGGGLGGRGDSQEEGTELLATCMPRRRRRPNEVDNPNEAMMKRRSDMGDDDDGML